MKNKVLRQNQDKRFGFTLIELLVAITIGILVVGLGSIALNDFNEKQKVEAVKEELLANLRWARNYAITNQLPSDSPDKTDRVAMTIDSNSGLMIIKTQKDDDSDTGYIFVSRDITPNSVWITTDKQIKFTVTNGRSINGTVNVGVSGVVVRNIRIDDSGLIYEE